MAFGRLKDAVTDLTETLRRVFRDPSVQEEALALQDPSPQTSSLLQASSTVVAHAPQPLVATDRPVIEAAFLGEAPVDFQARMQAEQGWENWAAHARTCGMPTFHEAATTPVPIPPLPRMATPLKVAMEAWRTRVQMGHQRLPSCLVRRGDVELGSPRARDGLALMLAIPVAVQGLAWASQSKTLQMRYGLELVKATGENIRNVEVLGLFHIPDQGVLEMRHDPRNQRLLLRLDGRARDARRRPFLLAKRREDGGLVSCFLEQG